MREFSMGAKLFLNDAFSSPMSAVRRATDSFRSSMNSANSRVGTFAESTRNAGSKVLNLTNALVGLAAGAAIKRAFDWTIGANADMQTYRNTLTVVLGSQEKAIEQLAWAQKFAAKTPFEIPQVIEATVRMESYGISAKSTMGIIGDMAAVMGKGLMQGVEAVADAQTGQLERLKEFGITTKMIQDQAKTMGSTPVNKRGQITDIKAFNAALFSLMEKRFKGGMEIQSNSFKGMISNVKDFMGTLGRDLGKPLFDKAEIKLKVFLGWLNKLKETGKIDEFIRKAQKIGGTIGGVLSTGIKIGTKAFSALWSTAWPVVSYIGKVGLPLIKYGLGIIGLGLKKVGKFFKDHWEPMKPFIQGITAALTIMIGVIAAIRTATLAWSIIQAVLNFVLMGNPIGLIVIAVGLLIGAFIKMNGGLAGSKAKLLEYWKITKKVWADIWTAIGPTVLRIWSTIKTVFTNVVNYVRAHWPQFRDTILNGIRSVINWIRTNWPKVRDTIAGVVMGIYNAVAPVIIQIVSGIVKGFKSVFTWVNTYWHMILSIIKAVWVFLGPFVMTWVGFIVRTVVTAFKLLWSIIGNIWQMISGVIKVAWSVISGIIAIALSLLTGHWSQAWTALVDMLSGVWDGIKDFFGGLGGLFWDSGVAVMKTLGDGILSRIMAPVNAVKNVFKKVRDLLPFSDAKNGPLSQLTHNGGKIMTTIASGVRGQSGVLNDAVSRAFSALPSLSLTPNINMPPNVNMAATATILPNADMTLYGTRIMTTITGGIREQLGVLIDTIKGAFSDLPGVNIAANGVTATVASNQTTNTKTVTIGNLVRTIEISGAANRNTDEMVDEIISKLHDRLSEADDTLGDDKGAIL